MSLFVPKHSDQAQPHKLEKKSPRFQIPNSKLVMPTSLGLRHRLAWARRTCGLEHSPANGDRGWTCAFSSRIAPCARRRAPPRCVLIGGRIVVSCLPTRRLPAPFLGAATPSSHASRWCVPRPSNAAPRRCVLGGDDRLLSYLRRIGFNLLARSSSKDSDCWWVLF
jgi:hypothetical protein